MKRMHGRGKDQGRGNEGEDRSTQSIKDIRKPSEEVREDEFSRRRFNRGAAEVTIGAATVAALATISKNAQRVKDLGGIGISAALDAIINTRAPIPGDLRRKTRVSRHKHRVLGYGHSLMAGDYDSNTPLVERIGDDLEAKNVHAIVTSGAKGNTTVYDLQSQWERTKTSIPEKENGETRDVNIWTGGNEIPPKMVAIAQSLRQNPLQPLKWLQFRRQVEDYLTSYERTLRTATTRIVRESQADSFTLYAFPNEQDAQEIDQITNGHTNKIKVGGDSLEAKAGQALLSILKQQGDQAVYRVAKQVRRATGVQAAAIDPANVVKPSDYEVTRNQHFGRRAAMALARERVNLTKIE